MKKYMILSLMILSSSLCAMERLQMKMNDIDKDVLSKLSLQDPKIEKFMHCWEKYKDDQLQSPKAPVIHDLEKGVDFLVNQSRFEVIKNSKHNRCIKFFAYTWSVLPSQYDLLGIDSSAVATSGAVAGGYVVQRFILKRAVTYALSLPSAPVALGAGTGVGVALIAYHSGPKIAQLFSSDASFPALKFMMEGSMDEDQGELAEKQARGQECLAMVAIKNRVNQLSIASDHNRSQDDMSSMTESVASELKSPVTQDDLHRMQIVEAERLNQSFLKAATKKNIFTLQELLRLGVAVDTQDSHGWTALMHAARFGRSNIVRFLLEQGANINAMSRKNETALMIAIKSDDAEIAEILLNNQPDITIENTRGKKAESYLSNISDADERTAIARLLGEEVDWVDAQGANSSNSSFSFNTLHSSKSLQSGHTGVYVES